MPAERLSMRQIREVLRLRFASKLPQRAIAKSLGLSQGAVSGYLSRACAAGVVWPLPEDDQPCALTTSLRSVSHGAALVIGWLAPIHDIRAKRLLRQRPCFGALPRSPHCDRARLP